MCGGEFDSGPAKTQCDVWAQKLYFVSERMREHFLREVSYKTRDWN